jgi:ABC-2 type transport system ATP-binding protein
MANVSSEPANLHDTALELQRVTKTYGHRKVVNEVSLSVKKGEIFGLLGPNGSGKTTTIRMALDIVRSDSGSISLLGGRPVREVLQRIGYLPEERGVYRNERVIKILRYFGRLKGLDSAAATARGDHMLQRVGLLEWRSAKAEALSRGMSQLVQFCGALLHEPDLIILDEPFSGLDPLNVQLMKDIIQEQQQRGAAIIFSTHIMADVEELCQRVALLSDGQLLLYGNLLELKRARGTHSVRVTAPRQPGVIPGVVERGTENGSFEYRLEPGTEPNAVLRSFLEEGIPLDRFEVALPSLNEIFIEEVRRARASRPD